MKKKTHCKQKTNFKGKKSAWWKDSNKQRVECALG